MFLSYNSASPLCVLFVVFELLPENKTLKLNNNSKNTTRKYNTEAE
jgi:hypothetical protein